MVWKRAERDPEDVALEMEWARNDGGVDPRAAGGNPAYGDGDLQQASSDRLYLARVRARAAREARDGAR